MKNQSKPGKRTVLLEAIRSARRRTWKVDPASRVVQSRRHDRRRLKTKQLLEEG